jgi:hypothetical protein
VSEAAETAAGLRQEIGHWPHAGDGDDIYVSLALVRKAASLLDRLDAAETRADVADLIRQNDRLERALRPYLRQHSFAHRQGYCACDLCAEARVAIADAT